MINLLQADDALQQALLNWVLSGGETNSRETKRVSGKMVGKALEAICAFANTNGGWLFLGVEDAEKAKGQERLYGIAENPEAVDELLRKITTQYQPPIDGIRGARVATTLRDGALGELVVLHVPASDKVHSILDGAT